MYLLPMISKIPFHYLCAQQVFGPDIKPVTDATDAAVFSQQLPVTPPAQVEVEKVK